MKVQTKILLLLLLIAVIFLGGLTAFELTERAKYKAIAEKRERQRSIGFDEFLKERGDKLEVFVEDSSVWDDMVRALMARTPDWADTHITDETLISNHANAVWVYYPDHRLFYSRNNRYTDELRELPLPPEAFEQLFTKERTCHFFLHVPQGWMEIRGGTIHPSNDHFRQTTPRGMFFAGRFWIDDNVRQMASFTQYDIHVVPADAPNAPPSAEQIGRIRFARTVPGWDGKPVAQIRVENDSPLIQELHAASRRLFRYLVAFALSVVLVLTALLWRWVRQPLSLISRNLECENPAALELMGKRRNEFGRLADLILRYRCTEQKLQKAEEELRHAQKLEAVGRLAGGVAHDFNNLLTAILGYSELLDHNLSHDKKAQEHARLIYKAGEQAAGLTRQLLAFSRKQLLQPKVLELNVLVGDMEKLLQRVIGEHIKIVLRSDAKDSRVLADPNQLEQVILNLGVNARDAMPRGGTLSITTRNVTLDKEAASLRGSDIRPGSYVALSVSDTGAGMSEEIRARIFEPFFTTKGPGRGTGLGLATVYGIVRQSGGLIRVESELGVGSTFTIELPHSDGTVEAAAPAPEPIERIETSQTILVTEDEEVVRLLVCQVLEDAGYEVMCASTPGEALKLVADYKGTIQLLVTDVVMPDMHGPELAGRLAALQPQMRVLYMSGYSENDISDQGVVDEDIEVLQKPFTHDTLVRKVRELLSREPAAV